jgi:L-asparagine transporter-like permease
MTKSRSRIFLIITQIFGVLALVPWFFIFMFSFMMFDSPDAIHHLLPYALVGTLGLFPLVLLFCIIRSWMLFNKQQYSSAAWTMAWIGIPTLLFVGWLAWIQ